MSRAAEYIRKCPLKVAERIEKASRCSFYILQESGPMAFTLGVGDDSDTKYKVKLGQTHSCSCRKHALEGNLCLHVLWSLLKIFLVDKDSDILFQHALTEREIEELITKRQQRKHTRDISITYQSDLPSSSDETLVQNHEDGVVSPRPISDGDVCPICQDVLLDNGKLAHCKKSCGNSMHVKCLQILINHQKSLQLDSLKCPLCRNELGSIESVLAEIETASTRKPTPKLHTHYGMECSVQECRSYPIKGNLYKCKSCTLGTYLCEKCFLDGQHDEHAFQMKSNPHSKWEPASRAVQPKLPDSIIRSLEQRELTEDDYDMLLTLDSGPQIQGSIPMHVINGFPLFKIKNESDMKRLRLDHDGNCNVCVVKIRYGELVRQIPCGHGFHRECIDRWLLNSRSTCPTCGTAAYTFIDGDEQNCIPMPNQFKIKEKKRRSKSFNSKSKDDHTDTFSNSFEPFLMIRGSDAISYPSTPFPCRLQNRLQNSPSKKIVLPPLTRRVSQPSNIRIAAQAAESIILQASSWRPQPQDHQITQSSLKKDVKKFEGKRTFGLPPSSHSVQNLTPLRRPQPSIDLTLSSLRLGVQSLPAKK